MNDYWNSLLFGLQIVVILAAVAAVVIIGVPVLSVLGEAATRSVASVVGVHR